MASVVAASRAPRTFADLMRRLGNIPPERIRLNPAPGTATEKDVLEIHDREGRLCELVDGTLVEKPMGLEESELAILLAYFLVSFVRPRRLGHVYGADGPMKVLPELVRIPDVAFISRGRISGRRPKPTISPVAPDLAIEVLSKSNRKAEIARKLREYFEGGTRLAWIVDGKAKTVRIHTSPTQSTTLAGDDILDGGDVLPGFALPLGELFGGQEG